MRWIRVGAGVLNQTPLAWDDNRDHVVAAIAEARRQGVSLLCLPELAISGYGCEDAFYAPGVQASALEVLRQIAPETRGVAVAVGLPLMVRKALFDAVALVADGAIAGFVAKRYLAADGLYYEPRWFRPWPQGRRLEIELDGRSYPVGDLYFDLDGVKVGFEICEDAWVARRPGSALAARGIDVILNPSASHFAFGKHDVRQRFVLEGSRAFGVSYVYANLAGNESGRAIYDGGALIASGGRLLAAGRRFSYRDVEVTSALIDVDATRMLQARTGSFMPELEERPGEEVKVPFAFPELPLAPPPPGLDLGVAGFSKEEAFARAIGLALVDYLRKSRSRGFVVSLSGGADSSAVACLVAIGLRLSAAELGLDGLKAKLAHLPELADAGGVETVIERLLLCVYQATRNSSQTTRDAARGLARGLGASYLELDVDALVEGYVERVAAAVGRPLTWERDDLALQNVQARVRSPGVWMLANLRRALLLSTSNRSEAAVGYATMDGDTSGGLAPIAGIDKAFLRRWLVHLERRGVAGLEPIAALAAVNAQAPTAELRPAGAGQTDEQDLMPYDLLEAIERAAIRDKQMPLEVYRAMRPRFPELPPQQLAAYVERFFRLWCRNQWKRERYAPSFHVDDENLDPKTWCRFPILSGGFEREIAALHAHLESEVCEEQPAAVDGG
ncbi:MAG: NAD(+) synthase [Acidobacteria bacterium]|nr:MAG: NAD(+) synthase [Acidobacteriota bacterium]